MAVLSLAALGQNILMGYAGQLSLGIGRLHGGRRLRLLQFDAARCRHSVVVAVRCRRLCAALVGIVFGLPSLRIRGFYLAVATLAVAVLHRLGADKFGWFTNYNPSGVITAQPIIIFGYDFATPAREILGGACRSSPCWRLLAKNMARGNIGRGWMAMRDMDVAAEVIGIPLMRTKLLAFAISSFYCGVAGALFAFAYLGTVGAVGVQPRSVVPDPVHGHHRRRRHHPGRVPRRRVHRADADLRSTSSSTPCSANPSTPPSRLRSSRSFSA